MYSDNMLFYNYKQQSVYKSLNVWQQLMVSLTIELGSQCIWLSGSGGRGGPAADRQQTESLSLPREGPND